MVFRIKPREEKFFYCFNELAQSICDASSILKNYFEELHDANRKLEQLTEVEERGDIILNRVMTQINSTFITPFDREDILLLARELNNVLDHIQGTLEKVVIYKAGIPKDVYALKLAKTLEEAAQEIKTAVLDLPDVRTKHNTILKSCEVIRSYEHEGDFLYRAGIARLFENTENLVEIIKWKEIYEHLETTLDYCENVSNIIKGVAVKYV